MKGGEFLLDTNILIASFGGDPLVHAELAKNPSIFLTTIVVGELYYGAEKSGRTAANLANLEAYLATVVILDLDWETSRRFGQVKQRLVKKGRPIPENDIWIAAAAIRHDLTLVTRDAHFSEVDGLSVIRW